MESKKKSAFILSQLEEALEERQKPDRRQESQPLSDNMEDRRKNDRRQTADA